MTPREKFNNRENQRREGNKSTARGPKICKHGPPNTRAPAAGTKNNCCPATRRNRYGCFACPHETYDTTRGRSAVTFLAQKKYVGDNGGAMTVREKTANVKQGKRSELSRRPRTVSRTPLLLWGSLSNMAVGLQASAAWLRLNLRARQTR